MSRPALTHAVRRVQSIARSVARVYVSLVERLVRPLLIVATSLITVAVSIIILQILLRNTIGTAPSQINTLATWFAAWASMLLIGVLIWRDEHLKIEVLYQKFSTRTKRALRTVHLMTYTYMGFVLVYWGYVYTVEVGPLSVDPSLDIKMTWLYVSVVVGGGLMMMFSVAKLITVYEYDDALQSDTATATEARNDE